MEILSQKLAEEILRAHGVELFDDHSSPQEVARRLGLWPVKMDFVVEDSCVAQPTKTSEQPTNS